MNFQLLLTISILTLPQSASFGLLTDSRKTLSASRGPSTKSQHHLTRVFQSRDWIDEVREDELLDGDDEQNGPPIKPDMKYVPRNVIRQNQNFAAIREAAGPELTNDLYIRDPRDPEVFFFVGKIARISDVTPTQAIVRQWNLIETHACNLRPMDLFPSRGFLEIWVAPGDSEMDVVYNRPNVVFEKIGRAAESVDGLKSITMGFQGEMYDGGEEGFRTWRNGDGTPSRPEIKSPDTTTTTSNGEESLQTATDIDMKDIQRMLEEQGLSKGQDINEFYKEQQRRAGKQVEDE